MTDVSRRRLLGLLGTGATAAVAGCNRLFSRPEGGSDATPSPSSPEAGGTETGTPAPTGDAPATDARAATGTVVAVPGYSLSLEYRPVADVTAAAIDLRVRNVSGRDLRLVELRVDLVFDPDDENRVVAVDYLSTRGLDSGNSERLAYETRYPNDGRTDGSTDPADFDLAFRVRGVEFA